MFLLIHLALLNLPQCYARDQRVIPGYRWGHLQQHKYTDSLRTKINFRTIVNHENAQIVLSKVMFTYCMNEHGNLGPWVWVPGGRATMLLRLHKHLKVSPSPVCTVINFTWVSDKRGAGRVREADRASHVASLQIKAVPATAQNTIYSV